MAGRFFRIYSPATRYVEVVWQLQRRATGDYIASSIRNQHLDIRGVFRRPAGNRYVDTRAPAKGLSVARRGSFRAGTGDGVSAREA